jgi:hypothetical protein
VARARRPRAGPRYIYLKPSSFAGPTAAAESATGPRPENHYGVARCITARRSGRCCPGQWRRRGSSRKCVDNSDAVTHRRHRTCDRIL